MANNKKCYLSTLHDLLFHSTAFKLEFVSTGGNSTCSLYFRLFFMRFFFCALPNLEHVSPIYPNDIDLYSPILLQISWVQEDNFIEQKALSWVDRSIQQWSNELGWILFCREAISCRSHGRRNEKIGNTWSTKRRGFFLCQSRGMFRTIRRRHIEKYIVSGVFGK